MSATHSPLALGAALARATARLQPAPGAALDAQLLLGHVLGRSRAWLMAHPETPLPQASLVEFERALARRAGGEPLAYITGRREFWSMELQVSADVLVPRPETELLVERALALVGRAVAEVADLGTGSGAIALALARERPHWRITATDRSAAALAIANTNARALAIDNVQFLAGEWFAPLSGSRFSLIASNPPYIAAGDPALLDPALRHEPRGALTSGATGLEDLAVLIRGAAAHLAEDGWLLLEHAPGQAQAVADLLVAQGFRHVRCHTDLAALPRVTEAQRPRADSTTTEESSP
jgi:release factor glutamine methyltransferase